MPAGVAIPRPVERGPKVVDRRSADPAKRRRLPERDDAIEFGVGALVEGGEAEEGRLADMGPDRCRAAPLAPRPSEPRHRARSPGSGRPGRSRRRPCGPSVRALCRPGRTDVDSLQHVLGGRPPFGQLGDLGLGIAEVLGHGGDDPFRCRRSPAASRRPRLACGRLSRRAAHVLPRPASSRSNAVNLASVMSLRSQRGGSPATPSRQTRTPATWPSAIRRGLRFPPRAV